MAQTYAPVESAEEKAGNGRRAPGRPRSEDARKAILRSTLKLLQETGFPDLSIEAIAARADVGKATVYRLWPRRFHIAPTKSSAFPTRDPCATTLESK